MDPEGEERRARDLASRALSARDRTVAELRTYLERKRADPEVIEAVVAELCEAGYLDDPRYARRFVEDRRQLDRWGSERIARDLVKRGVDAELVEAALSDRGPEEEIEAARQLLTERFPQPPATDRERDRAWGLLVRRGYKPELAYAAVRLFERTSADRAA
jgi:regulatory protein